MRLSIFSQRLREARGFWEMTQSDLAEKSGLSTAHICHFECGRRLPSLPNFMKLADALNCSADFLLGRKAKPDLDEGAMLKVPELVFANANGMIFDGAVECGGCCTMHYFFRSVGGRTRCLDCCASEAVTPPTEAG